MPKIIPCPVCGKPLPQDPKKRWMGVLCCGTCHQPLETIIPTSIWGWVWGNIKVGWHTSGVSRSSLVILFPIAIILLLVMRLIIGREGRTV